MALLTMAVAALAMDREEFKNVPPHIRQWFENMRSPGGTPCCSYADGHRTEYETRGNQYWVPIHGTWHPVPSETVILDKSNPIGEAVVWYAPLIERGKWTGKWKIICFVPFDGA